MTCGGHEGYQALQKSSNFRKDEKGRPTNTLMEAIPGLSLQQDLHFDPFHSVPWHYGHHVCHINVTMALCTIRTGASQTTMTALFSWISWQRAIGGGWDLGAPSEDCGQTRAPYKGKQRPAGISAPLAERLSALTGGHLLACEKPRKLSLFDGIRLSHDL